MAATGRACSAASARTSGFVSSPSGKRSRASAAGAHGGQRVGLVLGRVGGEAQQAAGRVGAGVVAGGQGRRAHAVGEVEHRVEAHAAVAAHARVGRQAGRVVGHPGVDDARPEGVAHVERQVREAHAVRQRAGRADGRRRAARPLAVGLRVAPQLDGHGRDLAAVLRAQERRDGAVDAAAQRHEGAARHGRDGSRAGDGRPQGPGQGVGGEVGGVELARAQAAEGGGDVGAAEARRVEHRQAAQELHGGAGRGVGGAAAGGVEARVGDVAVGDDDVEADEVAAGGAPGRAAARAGGAVAAAARVAQVVLEALVGHGPDERSGPPAARAWRPCAPPCGRWRAGRPRAGRPRRASSGRRSCARCGSGRRRGRSGTR